MASARLMFCASQKTFFISSTRIRHNNFLFRPLLALLLNTQNWKSFLYIVLFFRFAIAKRAGFFFVVSRIACFGSEWARELISSKFCFYVVLLFLTKNVWFKGHGSLLTRLGASRSNRHVEIIAFIIKATRVMWIIRGKFFKKYIFKHVW